MIAMFALMFYSQLTGAKQEAPLRGGGESCGRKTDQPFGRKGARADTFVSPAVPLRRQELVAIQVLHDWLRAKHVQQSKHSCFGNS